MLGPHGWVQTAVFFVFGLSLIVLALILYFHIKIKFKAGMFALGLLGAAFAVVGSNPTRAPGAVETLTNLVHRDASIFIVFMFPLACFLLAPSLKAKGHTVLRWITIGAGTFALIFLTVGGAIMVNRLAMVGLYERILLWNGQLWVELVCAQLLLDKLRKKPTSQTLAT